MARRYSRDLQVVFHDYQRHIGRPGTLRDAVQWGLSTGRLTPPTFDPTAALVSDMKEALRSETRTDDKGRQYRANAAITITADGGIQESLWGDVDLGSTPDDFRIENFGQRRKGVVDDLDKLKIDVDHYNDSHPGKPYQLVLEFTDDLAERQAARDMEKDKKAAE